MQHSHFIMFLLLCLWLILIHHCDNYITCILESVFVNDILLHSIQEVNTSVVDELETVLIQFQLIKNSFFSSHVVLRCSLKR